MSWLQAWISPSWMERSVVSAPASSIAWRGCSSSTRSTPSAARMATLRPCSSLAMCDSFLDSGRLLLVRVFRRLVCTGGPRPCLGLETHPGSCSIALLRPVRMEDDLCPAVSTLVGVLVGVRPLLQREIVRDDPRRLGFAQVNELAQMAVVALHWGLPDAHR